MLWKGTPKEKSSSDSHDHPPQYRSGSLVPPAVFEAGGGRKAGGAGFGWDNRREHGPATTKPANFGHFFMAIDPELFMASSEFTARVDRLIEQTKAGERAEAVEEILVPGESEMRARERSLRDGVPLRPSTYEALRKYGQKAGLRTKLVVVKT